MAGELKSNMDLILSRLKNCQKNIDLSLYYYKPQKLPEYEELPYVEIEYIQSTGTQWLKTGHIPTLNTKVEITISDIVTQGGASEPVLSGTTVFANGCRFLLCWWNSNNSFAWSGINSSSSSNNFGVGTKSNKNTIIIEQDKVNFNGVQVTNNTIPQINDPDEICLMHCPANNSYLGYKFYGMTIYENNAIAHQYIPVIEKSTNKCCVYDLIDKKFIYNSGSGNFIAPANNTNHKYIEFADSTGTQYIDTGIVPSNHTVEIKFRYLSNINNTALFGTSSTTYHLTWYSNKWYYACGNTEQNLSSTSCTDLQTVVFNTSNNDIEFNGTSYGTTNTGIANTTDTLHIYKRNISNSATPSVTRIYYCKIYDKTSNTIVMNLKPVELLDGTICFYDEISKEYFYNIGSGAFLPPPTIDTNGELIDKTSLLVNYIPSNLRSTAWLDLATGNHLEGNMTINDNSAIFNGTSTAYTSKIAQSSLSNGYTIIFRLKPDTWNNYKGVYGLHDTSGQNGIVGFQYENGNISIGHRGVNIGTSVASSIFALNTWGIYAGVFDGSKLYMYKDGNLIATSSSGATLKAAGNLVIGKSYNSSERFYDGAISNIMVFTRALSVTEMQDIVTYINANCV